MCRERICSDSYGAKKSEHTTERATGRVVLRTRQISVPLSG